jgi:hypothetical protein
MNPRNNETGTVVLPSAALSFSGESFHDTVSAEPYPNSLLYLRIELQ